MTRLRYFYLEAVAKLIPQVSMGVFVRKLEVVHKQVGGYMRKLEVLHKEVGGYLTRSARIAASIALNDES